MPNTEVMPCGHVPPKPHKARGMCRVCYKKWLVQTGRSSYRRCWRGKKDPPRQQAPLPRGDRTETWVWAKDCLDIPNENDNLYIRSMKDYWVVELSGTEITGAFGPLESPRQCTWAVRGDRIIQNEAVIEVMERRRDEFTTVIG